MRKKSIAIFISMIFLSVFWFPNEVSADTDNTLDFSIQEINENNSVTLEYLNESNTIDQITVSKIPTYSLLRIKNSTYTIKHTSNGFYSASFKIDVSSNKVTRAHSSSVSMYIGSLSNTTLTRPSSNQGRLSFNQNLLISNLNRQITATVNSDKISISVN